MTAATHKTAPRLMDTLKKLLFAEPAKEAPAAPRTVPAPVTVAALEPELPYTSGQQREIEALFAQVFSQKELMTSGRLQLLGFDKVRAKLGQAWPVLQQVVHTIADDVMKTYKKAGDICLRYKDDTYIMIFPQATPEEGRALANLIADGIGQRLEGLGKEALKIIHVTAQVYGVSSAALRGKKLPEVLLTLYGAAEDDAARAEAATRIAQELQEKIIAAKAPGCSYFPLWNTRDKALSAYLCDLEWKEGSTPLERDLDTLRAAKAELQSTRERGDAQTLVVPVRHGTLFNTESSQKYQMIYRNIPEESRRNVIFLIVGYMEGLPADSAFWFIPALKAACRHVFVEMPARTRVNLAALKSHGIDGVGVAADKGVDEAVVMGHLAQFAELAHRAGIAHTFVLNVPSLSLVTSASCMGFSYLSGPAIHGVVHAPDKKHRFRYADLFSAAK